MLQWDPYFDIRDPPCILNRVSAQRKLHFRGWLATPIILLIIASTSRGAIAAAPDTCPNGVFETDVKKIKESFKAEPHDPPLLSRQVGEDATPEISRIKDGAVGNYVGAFLNDGLASWWAYDAERHLFLRIEAMSEGSPTAISEMARKVRAHPQLARNQTLRLHGQWTIVLTVVRATPEQARRFACLVNEALGWRPDPTPSTEPSSDAEPLASANPNSPAEVTVTGRKPCDTNYKTDTFQDTFQLLKNGQTPQGMVLNPKICDCACQAHRGELTGRVSGYISQSLDESRSSKKRQE
jgi:hypothetical protein